MTRNGHPSQRTRTSEPTLRTYLALFGMLYGTLLIVTLPRISAAVIAAVVLTVSAYRHLWRHKETKKTLTLPGIGTFEYRITRP